MPTLMLDFDGVLNNEVFLRQQRNRGGSRLFDPDNIANLDQLCALLPVEKIVVSSSWREGRTIEQLRGLLREEGFRRTDLLRDTTGPMAGSGARGRAAEIAT